MMCCSIAIIILYFQLLINNVPAQRTLVPLDTDTDTATDTATGGDGTGVLRFTGQCNQKETPCELCEGDCEEDTDCAEGLSCFIRDSSTPSEGVPVPGCVANSDPINLLFAKDFCINATLYPCKDQFEDDTLCDWVSKNTDDRCLEYGQFCRETCGYCRNAPTIEYPPLTYNGTKCSDSGKPTPFCDICEGDCDSDSDCLQGLSCFQRDSTNFLDVPIPGCGSNPIEFYAKDFCYNITSTPCEDQFGSLCEAVLSQGVCSSYYGHYCRQSCSLCQSTPMVPSIAPSHSPNYDPNTPENPVLIFTGQCNEKDTPCQICEGDCDNDDECAEGLSCFIRDSLTPSQAIPVPGCATNPLTLFAKDFCYNATLDPCEDDASSTFCGWVSQTSGQCLQYSHLCRQSCGHCRPRQIVVAPSTAPSMQPIVISSNICNVNEVMGQTIFMSGADACWQVQLFNGGTLEGDFSDPTCSNDEFQSNGVYSLFDSTNPSDNTAVFVVGPNGFSGTFTFKEESTLIQPSLAILDWKPTSMEYELEVTIPACLSSICRVSVFYGRTYYLKAAGACWQVQLFNGGTLKGDFSNPVICSSVEFTSTRIFSIFGGMNERENQFIFDDGPEAYSGTFRFTQSESVTEPQLQVKGWNESALKYIVDVLVPNCN